MSQVSSALFDGRRPRYAPIIDSIIGVLAVTLLALSIEYGIELSRAPVGKYEQWYTSQGRPLWSTSWTVFYCGTFPLLAVLISATNLAIWVLGRYSAVYALAMSTVLFVGSFINIGVWADCGEAVGHASTYCYQWWLPDSGKGAVGMSRGVGVARFTFGVFLIIGYLVYLVFAAIAVHRWRRLRQYSQVRDSSTDAEILLKKTTAYVPSCAVPRR